MSCPPVPPARPAALRSVGCLLDLDEGWDDAVPAAERALAQRVLTVGGSHVPAGPWDAQPVPGDPPVLILDGLLWRETVLTGPAAGELLGPGDVIVTRRRDDDATAIRWRALTPMRFAHLGPRFSLAAQRWPGLNDELRDRLVARSERQARHVATLQLQRVEDRVLVTLTELAGRFGRVRPDGVQLTVGLTHAMLGQVVGARRSTVTLALGALREQGLVTPCAGGWVLSPTGAPGRDVPTLLHVVAASDAALRTAALA